MIFLVQKQIVHLAENPCFRMICSRHFPYFFIFQQVHAVENVVFSHCLALFSRWRTKTVDIGNENFTFPHFVDSISASFPYVFPRRKVKKSLVFLDIFQFSTVSANYTATATTFIVIYIFIFFFPRAPKARRKTFQPKGILI